MEAVLVLGCVLFAIFFIAAAARERDARELTMANVVAARGGTVMDRTFSFTVEGTYPFNGKQARVRFTQEGDDEAKRWTELDVPISVRLPPMRLKPQGALMDLGKMLGMQDIEVGEPRFDHAFRIQGDEGMVRRLLSKPLIKRIWALRTAHDHAPLEVALTADDILQIRKRVWLIEPPALQGFLNAGEALANALIQQHAQGLQPLCERFGLTHRAVGGLPVLKGTVRGRKSEVRFFTAHHQLRTRIQIGIQGMRHVKVGHKEHFSFKDAVPVGNPVLDMLVSVSGASETVRARLLSDEALTEALLTVVHGYPGASVKANIVTLVADGWLSGDELVTAFEQAHTLATMLHTPSAATPPIAADRRQRQKP